MYDFIINNFRGAFIVILTRGGWVSAGEVVDGVNENVIGILGAWGTDYINVDCIDIIF